MSNRESQKLQTGFTLIETLVAIVILMIGVIGPMYLAARGVSDGLYAQNQLAANYLAQEAVTFMVNRRDMNLADENEDNWLHWIDNCEGLTCEINAQDYNGPSKGISVCGALGSCGKLVYDRYDPNNPNNTGYYVAPADADNPFGPVFTRTVTVSEVQFESEPPPENNGPVEIKILVTITWLNRSAEKSLILAEHLYRNQDFNQIPPP